MYIYAPCTWLVPIAEEGVRLSGTEVRDGMSHYVGAAPLLRQNLDMYPWLALNSVALLSVS